MRSMTKRLQMLPNRKQIQPKSKSPPLSKPFPCIVGSIVYLALYRGAGVTMGQITRHKYGANDTTVGIYVLEDDGNETYLSYALLGRLVFRTFREAVAEILRRNEEGE